MSDPAGPLLPWEATPPVIGPAPGVEFAPYGQRLVAYILDSCLVAILAIAFWLPFFAIAPGLETSAEIDPGTLVLPVLFGLAGIVVAILYFPFFWATSGQTPGMRPFGLQVVRDIDGARFGWGTALLRVLGMYVASSVFYLGFIWIFVDARRRGFQDLIAGTVVVKRS